MCVCVCVCVCVCAHIHALCNACEFVCAYHLSPSNLKTCHTKAATKSTHNAAASQQTEKLLMLIAISSYTASGTPVQVSAVRLIMQPNSSTLAVHS